MKKIIAYLITLTPFTLFAQNNNAPSSKDIHDIKITGYLQTQYQKAQSNGIVSFSGGDFSQNSDSRFMIRRGRLKIDRVDEYSNIVFQLDATQNGVNLMDAFIQLHLPKVESFLLTGGLFNRPFGYSIIYSSGYRDFPERARVFQTLMPRERDLGAMISYKPHQVLKYLSADLAVINGSGLTARDYDSKKDIVANLAFDFDSLANKTMSLGFGASYYGGTVRSNTDTYFTFKDHGFVALTNSQNVGKNLKREYYGANLQFQFANPLGKTSFKTEYVEGTQPGIAASTTVNGPTASTSFNSQPASNLYLRKFNGYYFWFTHQIAKTNLTALLAYDVYDPNTEVKEAEIGKAGNNTTAGDIKYATLGYGLTYAINGRIKLTLYNEHVKNNPTQANGYQEDLKDDVFTARLQYRW
ncbi:porin [Pedobacter montanisoli]|uniref:Porin n=1 Tax=Pedobacter montanisoli TaxID=2923277 RepID=A0ABS9ZWD6_9SPHI|nr:porin [Pedobacter montanisoli]MCJ0742618.1 porin [Pedobacter montanisoli]